MSPDLALRLNEQSPPRIVPRTMRVSNVPLVVIGTSVLKRSADAVTLYPPSPTKAERPILSRARRARPKTRTVSFAVQRPRGIADLSVDLVVLVHREATSRVCRSSMASRSCRRASDRRARDVPSGISSTSASSRSCSLPPRTSGRRPDRSLAAQRPPASGPGGADDRRAATQYPSPPSPRPRAGLIGRAGDRCRSTRSAGSGRPR